MQPDFSLTISVIIIPERTESFKKKLVRLENGWSCVRFFIRFSIHPLYKNDLTTNTQSLSAFKSAALTPPATSSRSPSHAATRQDTKIALCPSTLAGPKLRSQNQQNGRRRHTQLYHQQKQPAQLVVNYSSGSKHTNNEHTKESTAKRLNYTTTNYRTSTTTSST